MTSQPASGRWMTRVADPAVVDQHADRWTAGQLACRLSRFHDWTGQRARTVLLHYGSTGDMRVEQACGRRCGVVRRAWWDQETGRLRSAWSTDYKSPQARNYLLADENGRSFGRIDEAGMARLRLRAWSGLAVVEVIEDDG